ncbi:unnamed protein product [Aphanomyces euteiches]|uniref:Phosphomethylpyrimidine kinase n=1 Tax=Aphanomyces euteiches TaxID=100861 RepID=A0A6G0X2L8_9STRA|nr:hypothetical protein Ae201684_008997 [Aphanomyces euteiches]KAH9144598.1 hypothetical protein AeRB84_011456 [Aphanomyces euteiches]
MKLSLHLWESAASTRFSCLYHAFVLGIGRGTLPLDAFQTFLLQDAFFLHGFLQAFAHAVTKAATTTDTITLVTLMQGVNDELKLHTSYMESWGIDPSIVESTDATPATQAYVDFLLTTAKSSQSISEILAAMVPCARLYAFLGHHFKAANPAPKYAKWIETYASREFETSAIAIESLLDATALRENMPTARLEALYHQAMTLELNFFEAYYPSHEMPLVLAPISIAVMDDRLLLRKGRGDAMEKDFDGSPLGFLLDQNPSATSYLVPETATEPERQACIAACALSQGTINAATESFQRGTPYAVPRVLCIAGSDSGGGAGIQADMKACTALGVFSTTALTAITVQDTNGVHGIHNIPLDILEAQIDCVLDDIGANVIKTGMLASKEIVECVVRATRNRHIPLVVDPVMVSTSGHRLLQDDALECLVQQLFPLALVITPNIPEASVLLDGRSIASVEDMKIAAADLHKMSHSQYVLVKGGHLDAENVVDVLFDGTTWQLFESPRIFTPNTHGTGCTLASSIAAIYAKVSDVPLAVGQAIRYVHSILHRSQHVQIGQGHHGPMLHWL